MSEPNPLFRVVLRGYDPTQVDRRLEELATALQEAARQRDDFADQVASLTASRERETTTAPEASYEGLGERIGQMLALAEEEAADLRGRAASEALTRQTAVQEQAARLRGEAERYADQTRRDAETDVARLLEDARRAADQLVDAAERDAAARLQEAEAVYEEQRARAAKAAADFETTLASRKQHAEQEFSARLQEGEHRLAEMSREVDSTRIEADRLRAAATEDARRILADAEVQATAVVSEAKTLAARVRADSERELSAATQRRDSINAQLANVRQMLATLTGASSVPEPWAHTAPAVPVTDDLERAVEEAVAGEEPVRAAMPEQTPPAHDRSTLENAD